METRGQSWFLLLLVGGGGGVGSFVLTFFRGLLGFLRVRAVLAVFLGLVFTAHPPGQGDAARE
jgi:hypothetical protein